MHINLNGLEFMSIIEEEAKKKRLLKKSIEQTDDSIADKRIEAMKAKFLQYNQN
jgi:hypothetical protein